MELQHVQVSSDNEETGTDQIVRLVTLEAVSATSMLDNLHTKCVGIKCPDCVIGDTGTGIHIV
eukprot:5184848-Heterocapsa_arctica.AAC.1